MSDRYFGRVVKILDQYNIVMNKGENHGVQVGQRFVIVGLGDFVVDPDTNEKLERLEIVRGHISVKHVQPTITTLESCEYQPTEDKREIKKVTSKSPALLIGLMESQNTVTESIIPGKRHLKPLEDVKIDDYIIKTDD